ncbi:MAG: lytic transglycosylase domain-containing protein [Candidatus Curtissbacteria bacterium]|nr:lytic transglycosylase domain-containing protein [Candidatus Curtissbacteria bacterium]
MPDQSGEQLRPRTTSRKPSRAYENYRLDKRGMSPIEYTRKLFKSALKAGEAGVVGFMLIGMANLAADVSIGHADSGEGDVKISKQKPAEHETGRKTATVSEDNRASAVSKVEMNDLFREVFPSASPQEYAEIYQKVEKYVGTKGVGEVGQFDTMKAFLAGYGDHVEIQAMEQDLDPRIVKALIFIESRGDRYAKSGVGALGVCQFMPETARDLGLRVDGEIDERENPYLCIIKMTEYLSALVTTFDGDVGKAIWAYHAGQGNVLRAEKSMKKKAPNAHAMLKDGRVVNFIYEEGLGDDTENYLYKTLAAAKQF